MTDRISHCSYQAINLSLTTFFLCFLLSCSNDDSPGGVVIEPDAEEVFFISADFDEQEYILTTDNLDSGTISVVGNGTELLQSGYIWMFQQEKNAAVGLIYRQGEPGVGLGYTVDTTGLKSLGQFQITSRFTSYGFFDDYALTSVGGQTPTDENGAALLYEDGNERRDGVAFNFIDLSGGLGLEVKNILTKDLIAADQQVTFSGIVDHGNGEFLVGAVVSQAQDESEEGGASTGTVVYPDSCWVVAFDESLNVTHVFRSDKLSYSSGRFRSRYYSQIAKADDGHTYVFSGSYEQENTTKPCGALRIAPGATDFDEDYYFNIEALTDGYHFRRVWHITEDYFLLEFYNEVAFITNTVARQFGVVNMTSKTFNWVTGEIPSKDEIIDEGLPLAHNGKIYLPLTTETDYPTVYLIDPQTAIASKGITIQSTNVEALGVFTLED